MLEVTAVEVGSREVGLCR